ncbi:MAG: J domain-containing protein [Clostridia bacterium]|nr:J domain-containing protein [Clostridia bacterium]
MKDPYQVLGIPRSASDEEVKRAYRSLARKWHPDNYAGSAQAAGYEEIMKEINEAYDAIQKERAGGGPSFSGGGTQSSFSSYTSAGTTSFEQVRELIAQGRYADAKLIIDSTPPADRGAEWNYLKGCLLIQRGAFYDAQAYIEKACYLDPDNKEYSDARDNLRARASSYGQDFRRSSGSGGDFDCCSICASVMIADACCDCCGGRGCC